MENGGCYTVGYHEHDSNCEYHSHSNSCYTTGSAIYGGHEWINPHYHANSYTGGTDSCSTCKYCGVCSSNWNEYGPTCDKHITGYNKVLICKKSAGYQCGSPINRWKLGCGKTTDSIDDWNLICDKVDLFKITLTKNINENGYIVSTDIDIIDEDVEITNVSWNTGDEYDCLINDNGEYKLTITYVDKGITKTETVDYVVDDFFLNIEGSVLWADGNNKFRTRPDSVDVILIRDGERIDKISGLTSNGINEWSYTSLYRYSLDDGHMFDYEIILDGVESQTSPEDKYVTIQTGYDFVNKLQNVEADSPEDINKGKGYYFSGSIVWQDNNDNLGYRPKRVRINLYQEDNKGRKLYKTVDVNSFKENYYEFTRLPKYYFNSSGEPYKYDYSVEEVFSARYVTDKWEVKDAYTIYPDTPTALSFTNKFSASGNISGVKPDKEDDDSITIKTDTEDKIVINLKQMECVIYEDGTIKYGDNYSGIEYNIVASSDGVKIDLPDGKYEINMPDSRYSPNDIIVTDTDNIKVVEENGKWYLFVENTDGSDEEESPDIKIDSEDKIIINLKQMETITNSDGSVSFGDDYSGIEYNIAVDKDGTYINIPDGKYEINMPDGRYSPSDIIVLNNDKIHIVQEGDKWYMVVGNDSNSDNDVNGGITIKIDKTENYEDRDGRNNFFSVTMIYI